MNGHKLKDASSLQSSEETTSEDICYDESSSLNYQRPDGGASIGTGVHANTHY